MFTWDNPVRFLSIQVHVYHQKLQELDECVNKLVAELSSRKDYLESDRKSEDDLNEAYDVTDKALYKIVPGVTKEQWQITEKLQEHRHDVMKDKSVFADGVFYSVFIQEVLNFGLAAIEDLDELTMWKMNYDYIKLTKQIYNIKSTLVVMNYTCSLTHLTASWFPFSDLETFMEYAEQYLNKMKLNDSDETSEFLRNSAEIFGQLSFASAGINAVETPKADQSCKKTLQKLSELLLYKLRRREIIFISLTDLNSSSVKGSILMFCGILVSVFLTVICAVLFGYLLRFECRISIGVSDWLENVMTEVKEQDLYRELVLKRVRAYTVKFL